MKITVNTTGMVADIAVWTDPEARDHCVVVVKGTFESGARGELRLATEQQPLVYTDEHYGDPESTSVRYENDFAPAKPAAEIVVVGKAMVPTCERVTRLEVSLEIQGRRKDLMVVGDRRWLQNLDHLVASDPLPFSEMPLVFDRAFGGSDDSRGPDKVATERRNMVGVGFHPHREEADVVRTPLPNIERPERPITGCRDHPDPIGVGVVGRASTPRVDYAGTYDQQWLAEICPFLPPDFDLHYFMTAPCDQWLSHISGGEVLRCIHMAPDPVVEYRLPALTIPVQFRFVDRFIHRVGRLDTVILEPHLRRAMLLWRTHVPLTKKPTDLREILVGEQARDSRSDVIGHRGGKPYFHELAAAVDWLQRKRGAR